MRFMKWISIPLIALFGSSFSSLDTGFGILTSQDWELVENQTAPAAQSPLGIEPHWESYHEWHSFMPKEVDFICVENIYGSNEDSILKNSRASLRPLISVLHDKELYEFLDDNPEDSEKCLELKKEWDNDFGRQDICVLGARTQNVDVQSDETFSSHSIWTLSKIKSTLRAWPLEDN